jgi:hypothetical protein
LQVYSFSGLSIFASDRHVIQEKGTAVPCVLTALLDTSPEERAAVESSEGITECFDDIAANVTGVGYAAGADTVQLFLIDILSFN